MFYLERSDCGVTVKLAAFKIPSYFFVFDEFPLLSNGKPDSLSISAEAKRRAAGVHR